MIFGHAEMKKMLKIQEFVLTRMAVNHHQHYVETIYHILQGIRHCNYIRTIKHLNLFMLNVNKHSNDTRITKVVNTEVPYIINLVIAEIHPKYYLSRTCYIDKELDSLLKLLKDINNSQIIRLNY